MSGSTQGETPPEVRVTRVNGGQDGSSWFVGTARMGVLAIVAFGAYRMGTYAALGIFLFALYAFAFATNAAYLVSGKRAKAVPRALAWTQTLLDFGVVAATIAFTGGTQSLFTPLLVTVILEAGLILGLTQGFLFATLALIFMGIQAAIPALVPVASEAVAGAQTWLESLYHFVIQTLAFYLTAFISGYWNQRIHRMEQFQRDILDNMNNGFLVTDHTGMVTSVNTAATAILDLEEGNVIGKPVDQVLRVASGGESPILTALRSRRDFISYEFHALTRTNETKLLGLTTSHIYDSRKNITGIIASFSDLTEIARMRLELQTQDRLAAVGELAAGLAHEVRNPVASIRGAVDELQGSLSSPALASKLTAIAIRESDHLNDIVSGFLDFARSPELKREVFDVRDVIAEVRDLMEHDHGQNGVLHITAAMPEHPCLVSGAPTQIKQVFTNLCKNAIDAMEGRGTVSVTVMPCPGSYEIRVDDEGPGIAPDKVTRIFEPFYSEKEKGVGMGLAICSRIVTAHDGAIRAGSRERGGASMTVRLPAVPGRG